MVTDIANEINEAQGAQDGSMKNEPTDPVWLVPFLQPLPLVHVQFIRQSAYRFDIRLHFTGPECVGPILRGWRTDPNGEPAVSGIW